jgi:hypothetical protein
MIVLLIKNIDGSIYNLWLCCQFNLFGSMYSQDVEYFITFTVWFIGVCWTVYL